MAQGAPRRGRGPSVQKTTETQRRICEAALARFLDDGFERTRMLDVARDAGLAKGTLYLYFPTKEDLFEGVVSQMLGSAVQQLDVASPRDDESTLDFVLRAVLPLVTDDQAARRQSFFRLLLSEGHRFPDLLAAYRKVALEPFLTASCRVGARARSRGEVQNDTLERFPMLLMAPGVLVTIWNHMFPEDPVDPAGVFTGFLSLVFKGPNETDRSSG